MIKLILSLQLVFSASVASCIFQLGGATFDFSMLIGQDIKYEIGEGPGFFRVSVCSNLMDPCMNGLAPTAPPVFGSLYVYRNGQMCQKVSTWNPLTMMIAPLSPAAASQSEFGTGVTFLFEDERGCNGKPMRTQYNMMCDSGSDTGHIAIAQSGECAYTINWPTKHACAYVAPTAQAHMQIPQQVIPINASPSIPVTQKPIFPVANPPESFNFFGDFIGNASCAEPVEQCFNGATNAAFQLECKSCASCAVVMFADGIFYSAKINADVCEGTVLAGSLESKEGLNGYIYLHSYHNKRMVKGTLDIEPYQSSKYDLVLNEKESTLPSNLSPSTHGGVMNPLQNLVQNRLLRQPNFRLQRKLHRMFYLDY